MTKIRHIIENDIVEDISIYKRIFKSYIDFIKLEVNPDYEPSFNFDQFCTKLINNFEGVDIDIEDYYEKIGQPLTSNLMKSIIEISKEEFKHDKDIVDRINKHLDYEIN